MPLRAKLQEERFAESRQARFKSPSQPPPPPSTPPPNSSSTEPSSSPLPFKRLTAAERQIRREKGLCYNCKEKFGFNHRCKSRFLLLLAEDDEDFLGDTSKSSFVTAEEHSPTSEADFGRLSLNVFTGQYNLQTFQVTAQLAGRSIQILVDSGSSHNFLQARLAKQLGLITAPTRPLSILVGNNDSLHCGHMVRGTQLLIQEHLFTVDFHLIDLSGTYDVLGIQWLRKLGPILIDYEELIMKFMDEGRRIQLRGNPDPIPSEVSLHQLRKLLSPNQSVGFFYVSLTSKPSPSHSFSDNTSPEIQSLISSYAPLFTPPTTLPPPRPSDHSISHNS